MPEFESLDKMVEAFDNRDMSDYWDSMPEVEITVSPDATSIYFISIDKNMAKELRRVAKLKNIPVRTLVQDWINERLTQESQVSNER